MARINAHITLAEGVESRIQAVDGVGATLALAGSSIGACLQPIMGVVASIAPVVSNVVARLEVVWENANEQPYIVVPMGTIWLTEENDFTGWVEVKSNTKWRTE